MKYWNFLILFNVLIFGIWIHFQFSVLIYFLGVKPIHVKIYQLAFKYYSRMNNLIKSNDNHNVLLRNAYLEDKQLCIENKKCWLSCIKSLQRLLNVNFDTECKMLGSRLEKFFEDKFFTELQLQQNNVQCGHRDL